MRRNLEAPGLADRLVALGERRAQFGRLRELQLRLLILANHDRQRRPRERPAVRTECLDLKRADADLLALRDGQDRGLDIDSLANYLTAHNPTPAPATDRISTQE